MKNRKFISLVIAFVFIFSFINCIKLDTNNFDHLLTTSINELGKLVKLGWECKDNVTGTDIDILYTIRTKEKK